MCLTTNKETSDKYLKQLKRTAKIAKKGYVYCYKVVRICGGILRSFYRSSYLWIEGENKSSVHYKCLYRLTFFGSTENTNFYEGIHVFKRLSSAKAFMRSRIYTTGMVIIRVRCRIDDFVAANSNDALFTKVWLSPQEYKKALKRSKTKGWVVCV